MESEKLQEEYIKLIKGCTSSIHDCRGKTIKKVCDKVYIEKEWFLLRIYNKSYF